MMMMMMVVEINHLQVTQQEELIFSLQPTHELKQQQHTH